MRKCLLLFALVFLCAGVAQATPITYTAILNGANEIPPTGSPGTGFATVIIDTAINELDVSVSFMGLLSGTTASHIHCCAPAGTNAGVATQVPTFSGFPLGVTFGTYFNTFDLSLLSSWNPAFVAANGGTALSAEAAFAAGMAAGQTYLNIHTTQFGGGEIRGILTPAAVPEPTSLLLLTSGLVGAGARRWRKRRKTAQQ